MTHKILVTGCTGLVGHGICYYLLNAGYEVWGTSRRKLVSTHERFHPIQLELSSLDSIDRLEANLDCIDVIIHNAAKIPKGGQETNQEQDEYFCVNFQETYQLLKLAAKKQKRFIFISSTSVVNQTANPVLEETPYHPLNEYYASKIAAEIVCQQYVLQHRVEMIILRVRAPYGYMGARRAVIPRFIDLVNASKDIPVWGSGKREQNFTFVEDIGLACELAIKESASGIFNIAGPSSVTMKELAEHILAAFGNSTSRIVFTGEVDPQEGERVNISIEKARRDLGYIPQFTLADGLTKIAKLDDSVRFFGL